MAIGKKTRMPTASAKKPWKPRLLKDHELARFMSYVKVVRFGHYVCWEWQGKLTDDGYPKFWLDGQWRRAHRVAFVCLKVDASIPTGKGRRRPFPEEMTDCDHVCCNQACVRPKHLQATTVQQNQWLRAQRRKNGQRSARTEKRHTSRPGHVRAVERPDVPASSEQTAA
jgi:hypothetical protein